MTINTAALSRHALRCSAICKNGRFTRVGQDFEQEVIVDLEAFLRQINNQAKTDIFDPVPLLDEDKGILSLEFRERLLEAVSNMVGRMIQKKVQRQPSVGVTLKRTY